jgi:hypothetical protein
MQINREIDYSVIQLLTGKNFAFVATLMKDGSPQITPTLATYLLFVTGFTPIPVGMFLTYVVDVGVGGW